MMKFFLRFLAYICLLTGGMYLLSDFWQSSYNVALLFDLKKLFLFHLVLSFFVLFIIFTIFSLLRKHTAFAFLATSVVRMGAIIVFVLPLMKKATQTPVTETLLLIIPYFILTALEAFFTIKLITYSKSA